MSDNVVKALEICYLNVERLGAGVVGEWLHHNALESVNGYSQVMLAMFLNAAKAHLSRMCCNLFGTWKMGTL